LTEPAKEVIKDWRRPAASLLRLAISFGLSALEEETTIPLATDIHSKNTLYAPIAESLGLSD
ncbi:MAG: hypothetical protein IKV80_06880, partial [Bacteroidales bacterium]|nr:hypothetical protein [Bacteroidales bacterium]